MDRMEMFPGCGVKRWEGVFKSGGSAREVCVSWRIVSKRGRVCVRYVNDFIGNDQIAE